MSNSISTAEIEMAVLGSIITSTEAHHHIADIKSAYFVSGKCQLVCKAVQALQAGGDGIDILTVYNRCKALRFDVSVSDVAAITRRVGNNKNVEQWVKLLKQEWARRLIADGAGRILNRAMEGGDIFKLESEISGLLTKLAEVGSGNQAINAYDAAGEYLTELYAMMQKVKDGGQVGTPSGELFFDRIGGGWHAPDVTILAARPGMGKTALALQLALQTARTNPDKLVVYFSLEMSYKQLVARALSAAAPVDGHLLRTVSLSEEDFGRMDLAHKDIPSNLMLDDSCAQAGGQMNAKVENYRALSKKDVALVVIDYLQLMGGTGQNDNSIVAANSRAIKKMAMAQETPVLLLSQLSRAVESRGAGSKPKLSDLRDSGAVEQDADEVMFIYDPVADGVSQERCIAISKNRHGSTGEYWVRFDGAHTRFEIADGPPEGFGEEQLPDFFNT